MALLHPVHAKPLVTIVVETALALELGVLDKAANDAAMLYK